MQKLLILVTLFAHLTSCGQTDKKGQLSVSDKDCGPDATVECCFQNMPANVGPVMKIPDASGDVTMIISGKIFKPDGVTPYPGVFIYAYHTDASGRYSKNGKERGVQKWHGSHHGWAKTDKDGNYEIHSIRPGRYPGNTIPAHIHSTVMEPGKTPYWINDFVFKDDSLVTAAYKASLREAGGDGVVDVLLIKGVWLGKRDIVLKK